MKLAIALLLALCPLIQPALHAQNETHYQNVLNQVIVTTESAPITNISQTQHSMFIRLENRPALTCTTVGLSVFFEEGTAFESDPATIVWSQLGNAVTATEYVTIGSSVRSNTSGAIQNLRVNPDAFDTTNCFLSVFYIGTKLPVPLNDIGGDTTVILAEFYKFITVISNPVCSVTDVFLFYNSTDSVLRICENGVISDVGGGGGAGANEILLAMSDAVLLDETTDNSTVAMTREKGALTGTDPFYLITEGAAGQHLQWTFWVPSNYVSTPILTMWMFPSTAIGTFAFDAEVRCVTPDASEDWTTSAFDTVNNLTGVTFTGTNDLTTLTIDLTNDDSMAAGDLCTLDFQQVSGALVGSFLRALISYT